MLLHAQYAPLPPYGQGLLETVPLGYLRSRATVDGRASDASATATLLDERIQICRVEPHVSPDLDESDSALADETAHEVLTDGQVLSCVRYVHQAATLDLVFHVAVIRRSRAKDQGCESRGER